MKVCLIQTQYSTDYTRSDELFEKELEYLRKCDNSMDIIVLPEYTDIPCRAHTKAESDASVEKYNALILKEASETAKRCNSLVFINARYNNKNATCVFDRNGELAGTYFKQHLVANETDVMMLDKDYTNEFTEPTVIEIDGIRFGFLTCYDFYFYEYYSNLARYNLDVIIGCCHQRSDTHTATEIICRFLAYNTNAYVIRASVSMDENSDVGGGSMVVAPDGRILANMHSKIGMETADINIDEKYYKPAGYGNPPAAHYEYMEKGRRPWKYRPSGSAIVLPDAMMPYPRICADGGFGTIAPKHSMAALGAAIGADAEEIAISLKETDLEKALRKFSCHAIMNIFINDTDVIGETLSIIKKYDAEKHVYFTTTDKNVIRALKKSSPDIPVCSTLENLELGCNKILLEKHRITKEIINNLHQKGIICVAKTDDKSLFDLGIDTILTDNCNILK